MSPSLGAAPIDPSSTGPTDRPRSARRSWLGALALYLAVAGLVTLPGLGSIGLVGMEGMVADVATAMLASGDYVVPRLYGEIYTYKPPLVYWLTAASIRVGGRTEWALRLPSALALIAMGLAVLLLVGRLKGPRVGLLAGVASITSMMIFSKSKLAEFDAVLACAVGIAVVAACYNLARRRAGGALAVWILCYLALAAAFLAKGPPALMAFAPGLLAAAVATGRWRELGSWRHGVGGALFVVLVGGYLWQLWEAAGAEAFAQPLAEARQRGFEWSVASLAPTLLKPLMILAGFLPWSLAWFWSRTGGRRSGELERDADERLRRASLAFLGAGALVFMAVPTYEPRYFLPLAVAGAMVAALALEDAAEVSRSARVLAAGLATFCSLALIAGLFAPLPLPGRIAVAAFGALALVTTWALLRRWPQRRQVMPLLLVAALCGWAAETLALRPARDEARDVESLAAELDPYLPPGETIWAYGPPGEVGRHRNVLFYLDRPVRVFVAGSGGPRPGSYLLLPPAAASELGRRQPDLAAGLELLHEGRYRDSPLRLYRWRR